MTPLSALRNAGMTLAELMIVVAIVAILVALAAPNLSEFFIRNRLDTTANEFMTALSLARSEALRRGGNVALRRASGSSLHQWEKGWEVKVDAAGGEVIRVGQSLSGPLTLRSAFETHDAIGFSAAGRAYGLTNFRVFVLCHDNQISASGRSRSRAVIVTSGGRVQLAATNASGQPMKDTSSGQTPITSCTAP